MGTASGVSMHLLVLSAFRLRTFKGSRLRFSVSMHLLVLSAFRPYRLDSLAKPDLSLNAPFGAQCFPTFNPVRHKGRTFGSQCTFWCSVLSDREERLANQQFATVVSMHLLVLSAFRRWRRRRKRRAILSLNAPFGAQCFPTELSTCPVQSG